VKAVTGKTFEQGVRLEAVKAAARVASFYETAGISNLKKPSRYTANHSRQECQTL
jgi:hypothetical protein